MKILAFVSYGSPLMEDLLRLLISYLFDHKMKVQNVSWKSISNLTSKACTYYTTRRLIQGYLNSLPSKGVFLLNVFDTFQAIWTWSISTSVYLLLTLYRHLTSFIIMSLPILLFHDQENLYYFCMFLIELQRMEKSRFKPGNKPDFFWEGNLKN